MKSKIFLLSAILLLSSCGTNKTSTSQNASSTSAIPIKYKSLDVITFQPFYSESSKIPSSDKLPLPEGINSYGDLISAAAQNVSNISANIEYLTTKSTKNISLRHEDFANLGKNQIIIFEGHGSCVWMDNEARSVIWTGNDYDESKKDTDHDYIENLLINADYHEAITNFYVEEYCGDLTESIIYLDNCFSGRDSTLAKTFLDKGAAAVIGHTNTTQQTYGNTMVYETLLNLTKINQNTQTTNTIYEALTLAKQKYGKDDSVPCPYSLKSEPLLYGNPNWKITQ